MEKQETQSKKQNIIRIKTNFNKTDTDSLIKELYASNKHLKQDIKNLYSKIEELSDRVDTLSRKNICEKNYITDEE